MLRQNEGKTKFGQKVKITETKEERGGTRRGRRKKRRSRKRIKKNQLAQPHYI